MTNWPGGHRPKSLVTSSLTEVHKVLSTSCDGSEGELEDTQHFAGFISAG